MSASGTFQNYASDLKIYLPSTLTAINDPWEINSSISKDTVYYNGTFENLLKVTTTEGNEYNYDQSYGRFINLYANGLEVYCLNDHLEYEKCTYGSIEHSWTIGEKTYVSQVIDDTGNTDGGGSNYDSSNWHYVLRTTETEVLN